MSENIFGADNQQGSYLIGKDNPSETTRRSPFLPAMNKKEKPAVLARNLVT